MSDVRGSRLHAILSFVLCERTERYGMYGADVVTAEAVGATAVPFRGVVLVKADIPYGAGL